jgi:hypothetical protein
MFRYRLRQEDRDGSTTLSDEVTINTQEGVRDLALRIFPQPVQGLATITFQLPVAGPVSVTLVSALGSVASRLCEQRVFGAGWQTLTFDASSLQQGMYMLCLQTAGMTAVRSLAIVH